MMEQSRHLSIPEHNSRANGEASYGGIQRGESYNNHNELVGHMPPAPDILRTYDGPRHEHQESADSDILRPIPLGGQKRKHASSEVTRSAMSYPRKRAVRACQLCRTRKTKCNNIRPTCGSCSQIGAPCLYEDTTELDHSSFDPASLLMLDRLNQIIGTLNTYVVPQASAGSSGSVRTTSAYTIDPNFSQDQILSPQDSAVAQITLDESSSEYLHIPSCRTSADTILKWPIFGGKYPSNCLTGELFLGSGESSDYGQFGEPRRRNAAGGFGVQEEEIEGLIEDFLSLVHIKNPVLDPDTLRGYARKVTEDGPNWDGGSCLVYLACALGCLARTFQLDEMELSPGSFSNEEVSLRQDSWKLRRAQSYYNLARKRIGLLSPSILTAQCFFVSAIYLMYIIHPLEAWHNFHQASTLCHLCLQFDKGAVDDHTAVNNLNSSRRSEQRLYWSCFKSECEMRVEIDLPVSALGAIDYPYLFPSPPDASSPVSKYATGLGRPQRPDTLSPEGASSLGSHRHDSSVVHNQDESWYYYLTEIALRRIANRVLNAFYKGDINSWFSMHIPSMVKIAEDFEIQLIQWTNGLPEFLQYEHRDRRALSELPYVIQARVVEIRSWFCRPFLFYAVHHPPHNNPHNDSIQPFVSRALKCSIHLIENVSHRHRHHGTWLALRNSTAATLLIVAAVKCGHVSVPVEWKGAVQTQISTLRYWETESPDIEKARFILEDALDELVGAG